MQVFIKESICSNLKQDPVPETRPYPERPLQTLAQTHPCENPGSRARKGQRQDFSSELLTALTRLQTRSHAGSNSSIGGGGAEGGEGKGGGGRQGSKGGSRVACASQAAASRVSSRCLLCTNG